MGVGDWLRKLRREREQITVELAESGVAPEDEVRATEARVERGTERHGEHTPTEPTQPGGPAG